MNRRHVIYAGLLAAVATAAGGYAVRGRKPEPSATADLPVDDALARLLNAPLPYLDGNLHRLADWQGRPMVINFWASWCGPCVKELPDLNHLQDKYPAVQFVGIGIDTADNIRKFVEKTPISFPVLVQGADGIDVLRRLGNSAGVVPFTLVLDANGRISRKIVGPVKVDDLSATISSLLG